MSASTAGLTFSPQALISTELAVYSGDNQQRFLWDTVWFLLHPAGISLAILALR
jgi:hypothetical protein